MARLTLNALGALEVYLDKERLGNLYNHAYALLIYLACENHKSHARESVAELLWPEEPLDVGLQNLRQAISRLRKSLGDRDNSHPFLLVTRKTVQFNPDADYWLDVEIFQHAAKNKLDLQSTTLSPDNLTWLTRAADIYKGSLLDGFYIANNSLFEEWCETRRENCKQQAISLLETLSRHFSNSQDTSKAITYAQRIVDIDPWLESAQRRLLSLLQHNNQTLAALKHYQQFRQSLFHEMGLDPERETQELASRISAASDNAIEHSPRAIVDRQEKLSARPAVVAYIRYQLDIDDDPKQADTFATICREFFNAQPACLEPLFGNHLIAWQVCLKERAEILRSVVTQMQGLIAEILDRELRVEGIQIGIHVGNIASPNSNVKQINLVGSQTTIDTALLASQLGTPGTVNLTEEAKQLCPRDIDWRMQSSILQRKPYHLYALKADEIDHPNVKSDQPMIEREDALGAILAHSQEVALGKQQILIVRGDSGIGKSTLIDMAAIELQGQYVEFVRLCCEGEQRNHAFFPFIQWIDQKLSKLTSIQLSTRVRQFLMPLGLADDLTIETMQGLLEQLPDQKRVRDALERQHHVEALFIDIFTALSREQPLCIIIEDVQWLDPSSKTLVQRILRQNHSPWLFLLSARTETPTNWIGNANRREIPLHPLPNDRVAEWLEQQSATKKSFPCYSPTVESLRGNPLLMKHYAKVEQLGQSVTLKKSSTDQTLNQLISAQLNDHPNARVFASLAAVVGKSFDTKKMTSLANAMHLQISIDKALDALTKQGIVHACDSTGDRYEFSHILIRDTLLEQMDADIRLKAHNELADMYTAATLAAGPGTSFRAATHLRHAQRWREAYDQYFIAGKKAFFLATYQESLSAFRKAFDMLGRLEDDTERLNCELKLRIAIGFPMLLSGAKQEEIMANYQQAQALAQESAESAQELQLEEALATIQRIRSGMSNTDHFQWESEHHLLKMPVPLINSPLNDLANHGRKNRASDSAKHGENLVVTEEPFLADLRHYFE